MNPESPTPTDEPKKAQGWRQSWRWYLIGAAGLALLALLSVSFWAGWAVANQSFISSAPHEETTIVEVPALDPLVGDVLMPDVRGLDEQTALRVIADAGVPVTRVSMSTRPAAGASGIVIDQTPVFGTARPNDVTVVVSAPVAVPDLVGLQIEQASAELSILGAAVARVGRYEPDEKVGVVLDVSPLAGEPLPEQVTLTINVAPSSVFLSTVAQSERGCSVSREFIMEGQAYGNGLTCRAQSSPARTAWLLSGAVDRITGSLGIPDGEEVGSRATAVIAVDGVTVGSYSLEWGKAQPVDIRTTGALKLEITVSSSVRTTVGLGNVMLLGDPVTMSRLRAN